MPNREGDELLRHLEAVANEHKYNKLATLYPEEGPLRRELYPKHMQFFASGAKYRERAAIAANRVGKSFGIGGYETALHLTGRYPDFWKGKRFRRPTDCWAASDTSETTRDILQNIMLGDVGDFGTGLIPKDCILGNPTHRAGVPGAVDTVRVKHISGGTSTLGFKCFVAGTQIAMADGSFKAVEKIIVGEYVLCADGSREQIVNTFKYEKAPTIDIVTEYGRKLSVTPNHRLFTQRGKVAASELTINDSLEYPYYGKGYFSHISRLSRGPFVDVYCVEVENKHELIANGYRSENSFDQGRKKFQGTAKDVCIASGEMVRLSGGIFKPIQDIRPSDEVLSIDQAGQIVLRRVTAVHYNGVKDCIKITTKSGNELILTPDHLVYAGYHRIMSRRADLVEECLVIAGDGEVKFDEVVTKAYIGKRNVYDLSVEKEHRFICNNILVSNCWLDESPPLDVYTECLTRLMTRDGILICTFTPLEGLSDVVLLYLPEYAPDVTDISSAKEEEDY